MGLRGGGGLTPPHWTAMGSRGPGSWAHPWLCVTTDENRWLRELGMYGQSRWEMSLAVGAPFLVNLIAYEMVKKECIWMGTAI